MPEVAAGVVAEDMADKGLRRDTIGLLGGVAIGIASTTPTAGVALVFGIMALGVGFQMPGAILLGFLPILLIASAYYHLNRVDPDCGTTFIWATRAFGPSIGWFGGWIVVVALAVIVSNYAQLLGAYFFLLIGADAAAESTSAVTALGAAFFLALTLVAYRGIEISKRVQVPMLLIEIAVLISFAIVAIVRGVTEHPRGSATPALSWFDPTSLSWAALASGFVAAVLLYWGWDTTVMVNEESEERTRNPGRAAILSTLALLFIYGICAVGALTWAGADGLAKHPADVLGTLGPQVLGSPLDKLLILAVLCSAIAGGVFLPIGGARILLSMANHGAVPPALGKIHPRYGTPVTATLVFTAASLAYYLVMTIARESLLVDSLNALGLLVAFYYGLTGLACVMYFRRRLRTSWRNLLFLGLAPLAGSLALLFALVKQAADLADPLTSAASVSWFGLGSPLVVAIGLALAGLAALLVSRIAGPAFFRRRPETAPPDLRAAGGEA